MFFSHHKTNLAFGSAIATLFIMGAISYRWVLVSTESDRWVRHTHEVIEDVKDLVIGFEGIDSNSRRFLLTEEQSSLTAYQASRARLERDQIAIHRLTADNPAQQRRFPLLDSLMTEKILQTEALLDLSRRNGPAAAVSAMRTDHGQLVTDEFEAVAGELQAEEFRLLALRNEDIRKRLNQTKAILVLGTLIGITITVASAWNARRDTSARDVAEASLQGSEAKMQMFLDQVQDYAIILLDPQGQVVSWNIGAERVFGYTTEESADLKFSSFFPKVDRDHDRPQEILRIAAESGRHEEDAIRVRRSGSHFLATVTLTALHDPVGRLIGFSKISRDISTRTDSEARYRGLLEAAPDAMVVVDEAGEIVLLNLQAEQQFGYSRDELLGQKVTNIIPHGFAERLIADGTRTAVEPLAQQIGTGIELTALRKDGSTFPIEMMLSPLESGDGILVTAAVRDITVWKDSDARYRGLLEAAPDAMVVVDEAGEIVLVNLQAEHQFGYSRDELLGQKVTSIIPEGFAERLIADGTRTAAEALEQQIDTGIELIALRKNGSTFPIEMMLSPLESAEGILVTAAVRDITVRKESDARYRGLLEAAPDAMVVVGQDGRIVLLNLQAEKQFGYSRDELLGKQMKSIIPAGFAERLIADALRSSAEALDQQIGTGIELTGLRKDGSGFPIEIMLSPLKSVEEILITVAVRDITVRKMAEAQLLQKIEELNLSNKELEQFAYIASHDLQEPLRMVASYTQLLSRRYKGRLDKDADEFIAFAVDGAARMQRLIQDLLAYSRVGTKGERLRGISSEKAFEEALINLRNAIKESGALVTHDPLPEVLADESQLIQLFQNLVSNGIKYQKAGVPQIHISSVKNAEQKWVFSVKDNGLGIEPQYFEKIFGMFQRLHKREEYAGTGIGLAICKKIAERHGGNISVESQLGQGSTFRFALNAAERKT